MSVASVRMNPNARSPFASISAFQLTAVLVGLMSVRAQAVELDSFNIRLTGHVVASKSAAPVLASDPRSLVVAAGAPATFSVSASSATAMTYQWTRNGSKIAGAGAATYVMPAAAVTDSGASFAVTVKNAAGQITSATARLTVNVISAQVATAARPFSDQSPWNSRPTKFVLGSYEVPKSTYFPNVSEGPYSLGVFTAAPTDPAVTIKGNDPGGLWLPDAEAATPQMVIPHWPANVVPASGDDGHADIVDVANNRIHSFWQLKKTNGQWTATTYTWSALNGRGFGTPAQYMQGARAAGTPSMAGLIRTSEIDDGLPSYRHALAMSMTFNALASAPAYIFPATSADWDAATANSGQFPQGALMMIPASFDTSRIKNQRLLKIVRTLQSYGAYVVDRNWGTPYLIYVENGSGFDLMPNGWDGAVAAELDLVRSQLRRVMAVSEWVDAKGAVFTPETKLNLLSMRGDWYVLQGGAAGTFDTLEQAVTFPSNGTFTRQINASGRSMPSVLETPMAGKSYLLKVTATGNAKLRFDLTRSGQSVFSTGDLADGAAVVIVWPADGLLPWITLSSGPVGGGRVSATLLPQ